MKTFLIFLYRYSMKNKPPMVKTIFQVDKSYIGHAEPDGNGRNASGGRRYRRR